MRLRTGFAKCTWLFTLVTAMVLATNVAASNGSDFQKPPDWLAHGNDRSTLGYGSYEPINMIITGDSNLNINIIDYLSFIGWTGCGTSHLQAKVQPGGSYVNERAELRDGTCFEFFLGGNHLRVWPQNLPGGHVAYFMAVSKEHDCSVNGSPWHCIDTNGFNQGRDDLVQTLRNEARRGMFRLNSLKVEQPGLYAAGHGYDRGEHGWDKVAYDGHVAVLTMNHHGK